MSSQNPSPRWPQKNSRGWPQPVTTPPKGKPRFRKTGTPQYSRPKPPGFGLKFNPGLWSKGIGNLINPLKMEFYRAQRSAKVNEPKFLPLPFRAWTGIFQYLSHFLLQHSGHVFGPNSQSTMNLVRHVSTVIDGMISPSMHALFACIVTQCKQIKQGSCPMTWRESRQSRILQWLL